MSARVGRSATSRGRKLSQRPDQPGDARKWARRFTYRCTRWLIARRLVGNRRIKIHRLRETSCRRDETARARASDASAIQAPGRYAPRPLTLPPRRMGPKVDGRKGDGGPQRRGNKLLFVLYGSGCGADGVTMAIVGRLLKVAPGESVCDECLALALKISLPDLRAAASALTQFRGFRRGAPACSNCRRQTLTISYAPMRRSSPPGS